MNFICGCFSSQSSPRYSILKYILVCRFRSLHWKINWRRRWERDNSTYLAVSAREMRSKISVLSSTVPSTTWCVIRHSTPSCWNPSLRSWMTRWITTRALRRRSWHHPAAVIHQPAGDRPLVSGESLPPRPAPWGLATVPVHHPTAQRSGSSRHSKHLLKYLYMTMMSVRTGSNPFQHF